MNATHYNGREGITQAASMGKGSTWCAQGTASRMSHHVWGWGKKGLFVSFCWFTGGGFGLDLLISLKTGCFEKTLHVVSFIVDALYML